MNATTFTKIFGYFMIIVGILFLIAGSIFAIGYQAQKSSVIDNLTSILLALMPLFGGVLLVRSKSKTGMLVGLAMSLIFIGLIVYTQFIAV